MAGPGVIQPISRGNKSDTKEQQNHQKFLHRRAYLRKMFVENTRLSYSPNLPNLRQVRKLSSAINTSHWMHSWLLLLTEFLHTKQSVYQASLRATANERRRRNTTRRRLEVPWR